MDLFNLTVLSKDLESKRAEAVAAEKQLADAFFAGAGDLIAVMKTLPIWSTVCVVAHNYEEAGDVEVSSGMTYNEAAAMLSGLGGSPVVMLNVDVIESLMAQYKKENANGKA